MEFIKYKDINWYLYNKGLFSYAPPHRNIFLTKKEQRELFKITNAIFIRWTNEWDKSKPGEFWYVIREGKQDIQEYSKKVRKNLKFALRDNDIEFLSNEFFVENAYNVYKKAFNRYKNKIGILSPEEFKQNFSGNVDSNMKFLGAFNNKNNNILTGYAILRIIEDEVCLLSALKLDPDYLKYNTSMAIIYKVLDYCLNEKKYKYVSNGSRNIYHKTNFEDFLINKFKFRRAYAKLNIAYRWQVNIMVNALYPFRKLIPIQSLKAFLKQEEIRRKS